MRILLLLLLCAGVAEGATYHVRSGGSSGSGANWSSPFTSIPAALAAGDTVYVAAGSYPGYQCNNSGTAANRITIKKATIAEHGSATGWQDSFASGQAVFNGSINTDNYDYWTWDGVYRNESDWTDSDGTGFLILCAPGPATSYGFKGGTDVAKDPSNWIIQCVGIRCTSWSNLNWKQTHINNFGNGDNWLIRKCAFEDGGLGIFGGNGVSGWTIELCGAKRNASKEFIRLQHDNASDIVFRWNIMIDCGITTGPIGENPGQGVTAHVAIWGWTGCNNWEVYGNIFHETGQYPIIYNNGAVVGGSPGYPPVTGWKVYNNTFSYCGIYPSGGGQRQVSIFTTGSGNVAHNNLWVHIPPNNPVSIGVGSLADSAKNNWIKSGQFGLDSITTRHPSTLVGVTDNVLVDPINFNWTPRDPATVSNPDIVGTGFVLPAGYSTVDLYGNSLLRGGFMDIGAVAYGGVAPPAVPPTINSPLAVDATNTVAFSYQATASTVVTHWALSNAARPGFTFTINSSGLVTGVPNTNTGPYTIGLLATNANLNPPTNHAHTNLVITLWAAPGPAPILDVLEPDGLNYGLVLTNLASLVTKTYTVTNAGQPGTTLNFTSIVAAPFFISGGVSNGLLVANSSTNITVGVRPTVVGQLDVPLRFIATNGTPVTNMLHVDAFPIFPTGTPFPWIQALVFTNQSMGNWETNFMSGGFLRFNGNNNVAFQGPKAVAGFMLPMAKQFRLATEAWPGFSYANAFYLAVNTDPGTLQSPNLNAYISDIHPLYEGVDGDATSWNAGTMWWTNHIRGNGQPVLPGGNYGVEFTNHLFSGVMGTNLIFLYSKEGNEDNDIWIRQSKVHEADTAPTDPPTAPSNPSPADGLRNLSPTNVVLSWLMGSGAVSNEVWWTLDPQQYNLLTNQAASTYPLFFEQVHFTTTNYWRIVNWNEHGRTTSSWYFVTSDAPPPIVDVPGGTILRRPPRNATRLLPVVGP